MALGQTLYLERPRHDIFDADQSRKGYHLNQFCMSLMKAENRARFKADERAYLDEWPMTEEQKLAVLARDLNRCIAPAATSISWQDRRHRRQELPADGRQHDRHDRREYREMMIRAAARRQPLPRRGRRGASPGEQGRMTMARITASDHLARAGHRRGHRPRQETGEPYWQPLFKGYEFSKQWMKENKPDVIFLVYNDHATAFSLEMIPTFAIGCAAEFQPADEGWGARRCPKGDRPLPELASHIAQSVIQDDFDLTIVNKMDVDHGLTVPLSLMCGPAAGMALPGDPVRRQRGAVPGALGPALLPARPGDPPRGGELRRAAEGADLGHRRHEPPAAGPRAGLINAEWDNRFLDRLIADPAELSTMPHIEYVREAGSEGIELVMWLIARGDERRGRQRQGAKVAHRFFHVPASNTAVGHLILENQ